MSIEISKPFSEYVEVQELPKTRDGRDLIFLLTCEIAGTNRVETLRWPWEYSGSQEAVDNNKGIDGLAARSKRELEKFYRYLGGELAKSGNRLYEEANRPMLVRGPAKTVVSPLSQPQSAE